MVVPVQNMQILPTAVQQSAGRLSGKTLDNKMSVEVKGEGCLMMAWTSWSRGWMSVVKASSASSMANSAMWKRRMVASARNAGARLYTRATPLHPSLIPSVLPKRMEGAGRVDLAMASKWSCPLVVSAAGWPKNSRGSAHRASPAAASASCSESPFLHRPPEDWKCACSVCVSSSSASSASPPPLPGHKRDWEFRYAFIEADKLIREHLRVGNRDAKGFPCAFTVVRGYGRGRDVDEVSILSTLLHGLWEMII